MEPAHDYLKQALEVLLLILLLMSGIMLAKSLFSYGKQTMQMTSDFATENSSNLFYQYEGYNVLGSEIENFINNYWKFDKELKLRITTVAANDSMVTKEYCYQDLIQLDTLFKANDSNNNNSLKVDSNAIFSSRIIEENKVKVIEFVPLVTNYSEQKLVVKDSVEGYFSTLRKFITYLKITTEVNPDSIEYVNNNFNGLYDKWKAITESQNYNWNTGTTNYKETLDLTFKMLDRLLKTKTANNLKIGPTTQELQNALNALTGGLTTSTHTEAEMFTLESYQDTDKVVALGTGEYSLKMGDSYFVTQNYQAYKRAKIKSGAFCNDKGRQVTTLFLNGSNVTVQTDNGIKITTPGVYIDNYAFVNKEDLLEVDGRLTVREGKESSLKTIIVTEDTGLKLAPNALAGCEDVEIIFMVKKTIGTNEVTSDGWDNNRHELNCVKFFRQLTIDSLNEFYNNAEWVKSYNKDLQSAFTDSSYFLWSGILAEDNSQMGVSNFRNLNRPYAFRDMTQYSMLRGFPYLSLRKTPYNLETREMCKNKNKASSWFRKGYPYNIVNVQNSTYRVPSYTTDIPNNNATMGAKTLTLRLNNRYTDFETINQFYSDEPEEKKAIESEISASYRNNTDNNDTKSAGDVYDTIVYTLPSEYLIYDAAFSPTRLVYKTKSTKSSDASVDNAVSLIEYFDNATSWELMEDYCETFEHPNYKLRRRKVELYIEDEDIHNASKKLNSIILHTNNRHNDGTITINLNENKVTYSDFILQPYAGTVNTNKGVVDSTSTNAKDFLWQYRYTATKISEYTSVENKLAKATTDNPNFKGDKCSIASVSFPYKELKNPYVDDKTGRLLVDSTNAWEYNNKFSVTENQKIKIEDDVEYKGKMYDKKISFMLNTYTISHKMANRESRTSVLGPVLDRFTIELK